MKRLTVVHTNIKMKGAIVAVSFLLPIILGFLFLGFNWITDNPFIFGGSILIFALIGIVGLRRFFTKVYIFETDGKTFTIANARTAEKFQIDINSISLIRYRAMGLAQTATFFSGSRNLFEIRNHTNENKKAQATTADLVSMILPYMDFIKTNQVNKTGGLGGIFETDYVQKNAINSGVVKEVQNIEKQSKKNIIWIAASTAILFLAILLAPFFINPKAFYDFKDNKVYFGSNEMVGVNPNEFETISYNVAKDSANYYFRGEKVDVDYKTFYTIHTNLFYGDKNHIYYEESNLYSKNKLAILEGDYDKTTFENIAFSSLYRDKDHLYKIDVFADPPLQKIDSKGINVDKLQEVGSFWMKDDKMIYFDNFGDLTPRPDLDYNTFEMLSHYVVKDKNKVLYLAKDLKTDDQAASDEFEYLELKGADAPTFEMIDINTYQDKNTTWRILKEGQNTPSCVFILIGVDVYHFKCWSIGSF